MLETEIRKYLIEQPSIKNVINNRIYPHVIPENAPFPAIAYNEVSGLGHHDINVNFPRLQYSCYSTQYVEAKQLRRYVKDALKGYKGMMGDKKIIQISVEGEYETYESDRGIYGALIDFKIIYWE